MRIVNYFHIFSFIGILLSFTACGGGKDTPLSNEADLNTTKSVVGYLIDSPVANMDYHCGDIISKTQNDGKFECNTLPVIFMVGDIEVGRLYKMTSDLKVYPQDLVGVDREDFNNSKVLKIASFLQSLDDDGNISDTITISNNIQIDGSYKLDEMSQEEVTKLLENSGIEPVSPKEAEIHLREYISTHLTATPTPTPTATPTPTPTVTPTPMPTVTPTPMPTATPTPDTTPPAKNSTINKISTDDTTPPLSGRLPYGENDTNTTNYTVVVDINGTEYDATNNQDGTWSIADNVISPLEEGFYTVVIKVTDEAGNSSSTTLVNKIEINNTGFIIDSAIEGIKYISGKYSGFTDINGQFKYDKDAGVTFYIGDESTGVPMGTAIPKQDPYNSERKIITLFDLGGSQDENSPHITNMGRFLQTLDADGDVSNGITIDKATKDSIALLGLKDLDFSVDTQTFEKSEKLQELLEDLSTHFGGHVRLLSDEEAKAHLVAVRDNKVPTKGLTEVVKVRGKQEKINVLTGVFRTTTGIVEGVDYRSGNQYGRTNNRGEFKYEEGKNVKFSISELNFGTTLGNSVISPINLVPSSSVNHPKPRNIIRLLSIFDADNNNANGIQIDNAVREALEEYRFQIDINLEDGKANPELHIPAGVDEFGAQFEEFEMGSEILNKITEIRGRE